jgi:hypothetical protein
MPFLQSELDRIRAELGFNLLEVGATMYVSIVSFFDTVVQNYIADEITTTATIVTAIPAASVPAPQTLSLASATGFIVRQKCVIDVDSREEKATLSNLSGTSATFLLSNAHSGTIPVSVEGPITIAREYLTRIEEVKAEMAETFGVGQLKAVDEIQWYASGGSGSSGGNTTFGNLNSQLRHWRCELAAVLGAQDIWDQVCSHLSGSRTVLY